MGLLWDLYAQEYDYHMSGAKSMDMEHFIITISRVYGSGGSIIGKRVAEKLGIACYDRNFIDRIAHENEMDKAYIPNWKETISSLDIWGAEDLSAKMRSRNYWKTGSPYYSDEKKMFLVQSRIISELAKKGSCVFVGRCADYVLRERERCLHVWVGADENSRTLRLYDDYWIRTGNLADKLRIVDKGRASYYKRCTGRAWGEHYNYHIHLDSGAIGIEECSNIICSTVQGMQPKNEICVY